MYNCTVSSSWLNCFIASCDKQLSYSEQRIIVNEEVENNLKHLLDKEYKQVKNMSQKNVSIFLSAFFFFFTASKLFKNHVWSDKINFFKAWKKTPSALFLFYSWLYRAFGMIERWTENPQTDLKLEENDGTTFWYKIYSWKIKIHPLSWEIILIACWNESLTAVLGKLFFYSFFFSHANKTKKNIQPCKPHLRQVWEYIISQNSVGFMVYLMWTLLLEDKYRK